MAGFLVLADVLGYLAAILLIVPAFLMIIARASYAADHLHRGASDLCRPAAQPAAHRPARWPGGLMCSPSAM